MNKKVSFGIRPKAVPVARQSDQWVAERNEGKGIKRLTLDIPASLHAQIKGSCALRGVSMVDEIRELLEAKYLNG